MTCISINLPQRRVYVACPAQAAYDWLCERFDARDLIAYGLPVRADRGVLRASEGWALEFASGVSNQLDGIPVLTDVVSGG